MPQRPAKGKAQPRGEAPRDAAPNPAPTGPPPLSAAGSGAVLPPQRRPGGRWDAEELGDKELTMMETLFPFEMRTKSDLYHQFANRHKMRFFHQDLPNFLELVDLVRQFLNDYRASSVRVCSHVRSYVALVRKCQRFWRCFQWRRDRALQSVLYAWTRRLAEVRGDLIRCIADRDEFLRKVAQYNLYLPPTMRSERTTDRIHRRVIETLSERTIQMECICEAYLARKAKFLRKLQRWMNHRQREITSARKFVEQRCGMGDDPGLRELAAQFAQEMAHHTEPPVFRFGVQSVDFADLFERYRQLKEFYEVERVLRSVEKLNSSRPLDSYDAFDGEQPARHRYSEAEERALAAPAARERIPPHLCPPVTFHMILTPATAQPPEKPPPNAPGASRAAASRPTSPSQPRLPSAVAVVETRMLWTINRDKYYAAELHRHAREEFRRRSTAVTNSARASVTQSRSASVFRPDHSDSEAEGTPPPARGRRRSPTRRVTLGPGDSEVLEATTGLYPGQAAVARKDVATRHAGGPAEAFLDQLAEGERRARVAEAQQLAKRTPRHAPQRSPCHSPGIRPLGTPLRTPLGSPRRRAGSAPQGPPRFYLALHRAMPMERAKFPGPPPLFRRFEKLVTGGLDWPTAGTSSSGSSSRSSSSEGEPACPCVETALGPEATKWGRRRLRRERRRAERRLLRAALTGPPRRPRRRHTTGAGAPARSAASAGGWGKHSKSIAGHSTAADAADVDFIVDVLDEAVRCQLEGSQLPPERQQEAAQRLWNWCGRRSSAAVALTTLRRASARSIPAVEPGGAPLQRAGSIQGSGIGRMLRRASVSAADQRRRSSLSPGMLAGRRSSCSPAPRRPSASPRHIPAAMAGLAALAASDKNRPRAGLGALGAACALRSRRAQVVAPLGDEVFPGSSAEPPAEAALISLEPPPAAPPPAAPPAGASAPAAPSAAPAADGAPPGGEQPGGAEAGPPSPIELPDRDDAISTSAETQPGISPAALVSPEVEQTAEDVLAAWRAYAEQGDPKLQGDSSSDDDDPLGGSRRATSDQGATDPERASRKMFQKMCARTRYDVQRYSSQFKELMQRTSRRVAQAQRAAGDTQCSPSDAGASEVPPSAAGDTRGSFKLRRDRTALLMPPAPGPRRPPPAWSLLRSALSATPLGRRDPPPALLPLPEEAPPRPASAVPRGPQALSVSAEPLPVDRPFGSPSGQRGNVLELAKREARRSAAAEQPPDTSLSEVLPWELPFSKTPVRIPEPLHSPRRSPAASPAALWRRAASPVTQVPPRDSAPRQRRGGGGGAKGGGQRSLALLRRLGGGQLPQPSDARPSARRQREAARRAQQQALDRARSRPEGLWERRSAGQDCDPRRRAFALRMAAG
eukprot:TRINITY_DN3300_c0_g2_i1.p1 TRINITY_DN3300_c0_g2~~TRINITY_DN3300_c0_g2_i1.p1  ORF type:complete len:1400 (+),score=425.02 TRINITY_DN3300_c0_g2_i1:79-4200(+)